MSKFIGLIEKIKRLGWLKITLLSVSAALFIAAAIVFGVIYARGSFAQESAKDILAQYDEKAPVQSAQPTAQIEAPQEDLPVQTHEIAPPPTPIRLDDEYEGYEIVGKLEIQSIDVVLPVISEMTRQALKVSVCYYKGELPSQPGNLIITGHNYSSGAHFGRLDQVEVGDEIVLTLPDGAVYEYVAYETLVIKPDQGEVLDEYENEYELTLFTCSSRGNRRFVVRCKPKEGLVLE